MKSGQESFRARKILGVGKPSCADCVFDHALHEFLLFKRLTKFTRCSATIVGDLIGQAGIGWWQNDLNCHQR